MDHPKFSKDRLENLFDFRFDDQAVLIAEILYAVRKPSGTVYLSELCRKFAWAKTVRKNPVEWVNEKCGIRLLEIIGEIGVWARVVTNTKYRILIDLFLDNMEQDGNVLLFNPLQYAAEIGDEFPQGEIRRYTRHGRAQLKSQGKRELYVTYEGTDFMQEYSDKVTSENLRENLYLQCFQKLLEKIPNTVVLERAEKCKMDNCNKLFTAKGLNKLQKALQNKNFNGKICFQNCLFANKVELISPIQREIVFRNCYFAEGLRLSGQFVIDKQMCLDFRGTVFRGDVTLDNCTFIGKGKECEVSFEDTIFSGSGCSFLIAQCKFSDIALNCYQANFRNYHVVIRDSEFSEGTISFLDTNVLQGLSIYNVPMLPVCDLRLAMGNRLEIRDCELRNTLYIRNVRCFQLENLKRFGGMIVSDKNWSYDENEKSVPEHEKEHWVEKESTSGNFVIASAPDFPQKKYFRFLRNMHPLLRAVCCEKGREQETERGSFAEEFLLLKKNFAEQGDFLSEDQAFLLFMRTRHDLRAMRPIYTFLDITGHYGLSPCRVLLSFILLMTVSAVLYALSRMDIAMLPFGFYQAFSGMFSFSSGDGKLFWYNIANLIISYFGWFFMGYFSVGVVKKTLRS